MIAPRFGLPVPAHDWAMFLDVDGTLLEFALHPDDVRASAVLFARLVRLRDACGGALALVSGRRLSDVDAVFPLATFAAAGQHGVERRDVNGGMHLRALATASLERARKLIDGLVARIPGLMLEDKGESFALHFRTVPSLEALALGALGDAQRIAGPSYAIQRGSHVVELKPRGVDKGTAIFDFMDEAPFAGRRPVFVGDDLTDEDGFAAVNALGGHSIKVGEGATEAAWRIRDVHALGAWLDEVTNRLESGIQPVRSNEQATVRG